MIISYLFFYFRLLLFFLKKHLGRKSANRYWLSTQEMHVCLYIFNILKCSHSFKNWAIENLFVGCIQNGDMSVSAFYSQKHTQPLTFVKFLSLSMLIKWLPFIPKLRYLKTFSWVVFISICSFNMEHQNGDISVTCIAILTNMPSTWSL